MNNTNNRDTDELSMDELDLVSGGGRRSTDELDPLGTSELSGSGEIIIYRDRNGNIEGTSETHGFMLGPDGRGDMRTPIF